MPFITQPLGTPGWIGGLHVHADDIPQLYVWGTPGRSYAVTGLKLPNGTIIPLEAGEEVEDMRERVRKDETLCPRTNKYNTAEFVYGDNG